MEGKLSKHFQRQECAFSLSIWPHTSVTHHTWTFQKKEDEESQTIILPLLEGVHLQTA